MDAREAQDAPAYPAAPWRMCGELYLSLFRLTEPVDELRPSGVHGVAFVSYQEPSPLTYSELLVARPLGKEHGRRVSISDIWVDSATSMAGGRELWAIPKGLCDFSLESSHTGPVSRTDWSASIDRRPIAEASFTDVSRAALLTPFRGGTWQPALESGGPPRTADLRGSGKSLPCRGRWRFDPDGPLGWLAGARQLASFRMAHFRMSFG